MNIDKQKPTLAARRAQLVAECAQQRSALAREVSTLRAPTMLTGGGIMQYLASGKLKLPLTIAGVVLGMIATRPSRAMPMLAAGLSLFKVVASLLPMLRKSA